MTVTLTKQYKYRILLKDHTWSAWQNGLPSKETIKSYYQIQIGRFYYNNKGRLVGWDEGYCYSFGHLYYSSRKGVI